MFGITAILIAGVVGVDYGMVEDPDRGSIYVIQIEPELAQQLVEGFVIESVIPPELKGIRRFRIQVGSEDLPKPPAPADNGTNDKDVTADLPIIDLTKEPSTETPDEDAFPLNIPVDPEPQDTDAFPINLKENTEVRALRPAITPDEAVVPKSESATVDIEAPSLEPGSIELPALGGDDKLLSSDDASQSAEEIPEIPKFDAPGVREIGVLPTKPVIPNEDLVNQFDTPSPIILPVAEVKRADPTEQRELENGSVEPALMEQKDHGFVQLASNATPADVNSSGASNAAGVVESAASRSWPMLIAVVLALLLSLGGNFYLGMTLMGLYRKLKMTSAGG